MTQVARDAGLSQYPLAKEINVPAQFDGDIDGWARTANTDNATGLTDADGYLIDELLTNLATVVSGRASLAFEVDVARRLQACTADDRLATRCTYWRPSGVRERHVE
jgi:hypothetical protein